MRVLIRREAGDWTATVIHHRFPGLRELEPGYNFRSHAYGRTRLGALLRLGLELVKRWAVRLSLAFVGALVLAGCCTHRAPEASIPVVKVDENGCWFDGCNTCCRTGASSDPLGIGSGVTCTLRACVKTLPGEK